ncbi:hypothetical protein ACI6Q2_13555 [Chitinophagaceae bacterium LWZ2-11]
MLNPEQYRWTAIADHDNPKIIGGQDHSELNRSEGYEMLYFINSLARTWEWTNAPLASYRHLESIIKTEVPSNIRTHSAIKEWISTNHKTI